VALIDVLTENSQKSTLVHARCDTGTFSWLPLSDVVSCCAASFLQEKSVSVERLASSSKPGKNRKTLTVFIKKNFFLLKLG
jgi:hypothetical protein